VRTTIPCEETFWISCNSNAGRGGDNADGSDELMVRDIQYILPVLRMVYVGPFPPIVMSVRLDILSPWITVSVS